MARPARYTLAQIQRQALEIVDREGLAGLSMRSLAAALRTGPMTLYNYLDGRDGLEELVVDAVAAKVPRTEPTDDWTADARTAATALWSTVREHPAAIPLILTRRTSSPGALAPAEALAAALARSGRTGFDLLVAFRAVMGFVMGIAQSELAGPLTPESDPKGEADRVRTVASDANPTLAALATTAGADAHREFEEGLTLILASLGREPSA
ncbi:TetR/AcrR family transcriptional regulator [Streptomyces sp. NPDC057617]|uniref:TetR/AcrR family transcriptional regulator n=1 Tax=Streptomyces sp. NPDC057617 TaxID=3346184 RepID=UPI0036BB6B45